MNLDVTNKFRNCELIKNFHKRLGWEQHQIFRKLHYLGLNPYNTFVSEQSVTNEAFLFFVLIVTFIKKKKKA